MILRDKINILASNGELMETVKAHVGTSTTGESWDSYGGGYLRSFTEETRALIKPNPLATPDRRYSWDGRYYRQVGDPLVRRKHGRDHHYTIKLERVSASA